MFFIHGDADGVRIEHIAEMFRLKGGGTPRRHAAALGIEGDDLARHNTRHADVTAWQTIVPMINDFLDAKPAKQYIYERTRTDQGLYCEPT